jgi:hypothetical protein
MAGQHSSQKPLYRKGKKGDMVSGFSEMSPSWENVSLDVVLKDLDDACGPFASALHFRQVVECSFACQEVLTEPLSCRLILLVKRHESLGHRFSWSW